MDLRVANLETSSQSILAALNTLPNQMVALFNAQYAQNPQHQHQQQQNPAQQVSLLLLLLFYKKIAKTTSSFVANSTTVTATFPTA
jgi:hypothetical protein